MNKFHVGDLVRVKEGLTFKSTGILGVEDDYCGKTFRIKEVIGGEYDVSIRLDTYGVSYSFNPDWLEPVNERIVIRHDGKTVTAALYEGKKKLKEGKAKCHPDDPFNFMTGAKIALERLDGTEEKKPEYKKGDCVVVKKDTLSHGFPVGSVVILKEWFTEGSIWLATGVVPSQRGIRSRGITLDEIEPYKEEKK